MSFYFGQRKLIVHEHHHAQFSEVTRCTCPLVIRRLALEKHFISLVYADHNSLVVIGMTRRPSLHHK